MTCNNNDNKQSEIISAGFIDTDTDTDTDNSLF